ncbi:glucan 1,4-alpha-glucosidase [Cellvibrio sp. KB43]|uniref:Glucan 1,4-alpha-glucosidase n=1 Tax=Cellvibrio polysaccharolyticus TaxID=2082724 RepID=A0A928YU38_9GAMM|nr:glucan 1,4-alpha-glucosidase [Cellvibrio polysaccharolyticus]
MLFPTRIRTRWVLLCIALLGLLQLPPIQAAERIESDHVVITWLAPEQFATGNTTLGIHFEPDPGWHVYWRNPGDSGAAPRFSFKTENIEIGETRWPYPARLPVAHLVNLGYEKDVAYLFDAQVADAQVGNNGNVHIEADLEWLVCKEECIPGFGLLTLDRPVAAAGEQWSQAAQATLQRFDARIPQSASQSPWKVTGAHWSAADSALRVQVEPQVEGIDLDTIEAPEAFPLDGNWVDPHAPKVERSDNGFEYRFVTLPGMTASATTGLVIAADGMAWEFPEIPVAQGALNQGSGEGVSFWILLISAIIGGAILNLMPCVFPVLSIKLFSLIQTPGQGVAQSKQRLHEGLLYTAGVLSTFFALGAVFLALRAGGAAIGWGFQLQSPLVVFFLIVLFWLIALAFLGSFEIGHRLMQWAGGSQSSSSFMTGVLAVFVAAPCTGPFMGAALGAAATLPAAYAMAIFLGLGLGLALPFLILTASPALSSRLPKPGAWMERLRQFFAFPLFATVLWLVWVLAQLTGQQAWLVSGIALLLLAFALWLGQTGSKLWKLLAWILALVAIVWAGNTLNRGFGEQPGVAVDSEWAGYNAENIAAARVEGRAVFIDFTAAWCITCQVNKKVVLDTDAANAIFSEHDVLRIRADWTRYDPVITEALSVLGRNSVPVYAFYPADGGAVQVLPQILSLDMIRELVP